MHCPRLPTGITVDHFIDNPHIMQWVEIFFGSHPDHEEIYNALLIIDSIYTTDAEDSLDMFRWASPEQLMQIWKEVVLQEESGASYVQGNQVRASEIVNNEQVRCSDG